MENIQASAVHSRTTIEDRRSELIDRFREAIFGLPFVADRVAGGQQFNAYEDAHNDEDADDEVRDYSICIGPINSARHIADADGKSRADLLEAALKLAAHVAFDRPADSNLRGAPQREVTRHG